jgi:hypothetical protein
MVNRTGNGWVTANPYNGAKLATTWSLSSPEAGSEITASSINNIRTTLQSELERRGYTGSLTSASSGATISATLLTSYATQLNVGRTVSPPSVPMSIVGSQGNIRSGQTSDPLFSDGWSFTVGGTWPVSPNPSYTVAAFNSGATFSSGTSITASSIKTLVDGVKNAGAVCLCNRNYCTCNCNYCTCNCNYACTCNCNYSDRRLKRNIKFLKNIFGINIYTFNYIWSDVDEVGVMAQELLKTKYKNCVYVDKKGFYMVDYTKLPFKI